MDLVGVCPKNFFADWIAEGDAAGDPPTGQEWGWYTRSRLAPSIQPGDRFYVVAHGKLRGYAPVTRVLEQPEGGWIICRKADAVAVTLDTPLPGFRGLRRRWWERDREKCFPDWRTP